MEKIEEPQIDNYDRYIQQMICKKMTAIEDGRIEDASSIEDVISFIKSIRMENQCLFKANTALKNDLRMRLACSAMQGMIAGGTSYSFFNVPSKAFATADAMIKEAEK